MTFEPGAPTRLQLAYCFKENAEAETQRNLDKAEWERKQRAGLEYYKALQGHDECHHCATPQERGENVAGDAAEVVEFSPEASTRLCHGSEGCRDDSEDSGPDGGAMQKNHHAAGVGKGGVRGQCVMCSARRKADAQCAKCSSRLHCTCAISLDLNLGDGSAGKLWGGVETASPNADVMCVQCACQWYPPCCVARYAACAWCLLFLVSSHSCSLLPYCRY